MHFPLSFCKTFPYFFHGAFAPSFIWSRRPWGGGLVLGGQPRPYIQRGRVPWLPNFGVLLYLCLHPLTQNDQIRYGNMGSGVFYEVSYTPLRLYKCVARFVSDSWDSCLLYSIGALCILSFLFFLNDLPIRQVKTSNDAKLLCLSSSLCACIFLMVALHQSSIVALCLPQPFLLSILHSKTVHIRVSP